MDRKTFFHGAATLGISGAATKLLGALYKIALLSLTGCLTLGIYQSTYAFYAFIVTLCSAGVSSALSKRVAEERLEGASGNEAFQAFFRIFLFVGLIGGIVSAFPVLFRPSRESNAAAGYFFLALGVPFVCASSVFCGAYQGEGRMLPTAVSETAGQIAKLIIGLLCCFLFRKSPAKAAAALCLAVALSAAIETEILFLYRKKSAAAKSLNIALFRVKTTPSLAQDLAPKNVLLFTMPVTAAAALLPFTAFLESRLLPNLLSKSSSSPLALYGLFAGGAASLSHLPATLCRGVSAAAIPDISAAHKSGDNALAAKKIAYACLLTVAAALPACLCLICFSPLAVRILFRALSSAEKELLVSCVCISSCGVVFFALAQTLSSCLVAKSRQTAAAACWGVACLSRILFDLLFVGEAKFSIKGAAIAEALCYFVAFLLILLYNLSVERAKNKAQAT